MMASEFMSPGTFNDRRELAIEVNDKAINGRFRKIAKFDWENSRPLNLSHKSLEKG